MKKNWRIVLALALALGMIFSLGCKLDTDADAPDAGATVTDDGGTTSSSEVDLTAPAATIGDNRVITVGDFKNYFDMYAYYYSMYGYDVSADEETLTSFQDMIMETLIQQQVIYNQAEVQGYLPLSQEEQAEADALAQEEIDALYEYYYDLALAAQAEDSSVDIEQYIADGVADESEYYTGTAMSYEDYCEWIRERARVDRAADLMMKDLIAEVSVTEEEISARYEEILGLDQESYASSPGAYKDDQDYFEMYGGDPVAYVPEGFSRVLHIYVAPEGAIEDAYEDYADKVERMGEIEAQYGELAFTEALAAAAGDNQDAAGVGADAAEGSSVPESSPAPAESAAPAERTAPAESAAPAAEDEATLEPTEPVTLEGLMTEYVSLKNEVAAMEAEFYSKSESKINEAYAKLEAGEDFAAVMAEYSEDADFASYPVFAEKGRLISATLSSTTDWSDDVKAYFAELELGQYSQVFQDDSGYHILYYLADETAGVVSAESIHDAIKAVLLSQAQDTEWNSLVDAWMADESVVTRYSENYRSVGAAA